MPSSARRSRNVKEDTREVVLQVVDSREACQVVRPVVNFLEAFRAVTQEAHLEALLVASQAALLVEVLLVEVLLVEVLLVEVLLVEVLLVEVLLVVLQAVRQLAREH
jgi:hypothetical protein